QYRHDRQQTSGTLHFVNAPVSLVTRFLHHDRPFEVYHRAVGAEHLHFVSSFTDAELAGSRDILRFAALFDEAADDHHAAHVLASGIGTTRGRDQASLAIDDVWCKATAAHFL